MSRNELKKLHRQVIHELGAKADYKEALRETKAIRNLTDAECARVCHNCFVRKN